MFGTIIGESAKDGSPVSLVAPTSDHANLAAAWEDTLAKRGDLGGKKGQIKRLLWFSSDKPTRAKQFAAGITKEIREAQAAQARKTPLDHMADASDAAKAAVDLAKAALKEAKADDSTSEIGKANIELKEAELELAQADLAEAEAALDAHKRKRAKANAEQAAAAAKTALASAPSTEPEEEDVPDPGDGDPSPEPEPEPEEK